MVSVLISITCLFLVFIVFFFIPKCYQLTQLCSSKEFFKLLLSFTSASAQTLESRWLTCICSMVWDWHGTPPPPESLTVSSRCLQAGAGGGGCSWAAVSEKTLQSVGSALHPIPSKGRKWPLPAPTWQTNSWPVDVFPGILSSAEGALVSK